MEAAYNFDGYRRLSIRKIYKKEVSFSTGSKVFSATIENLSRDGALLGTRNISKIKTGSMIIISIPFANKQGCVKSKAIVMWAENDKLGIQFI
ncbi:PilZ domain-containing protein [Desulfosarcina sp.]|uniref:PilZ domain-containing protein n=1 Tax=Desulfosarcina sp. TaxID=2027861 RepID=UPI003561B440